MKTNFKNIFVALLIVPLFWFCFTGCSNGTQKEKIMLTTENINEYLVVNYTLSTCGDSTAKFIANIMTSKRQKDTEFFGCEIHAICHMSSYNSSTQFEFSRILDYDGKSLYSFSTTFENYEIEITSVSGYILYNK